MYHKILVPLDGSKRADRIIPHVEELAKRYKAKVIFLQVIEYKTVPTTEGAFISLSGQEFEEAKEQAEKHLKGLQGEFREKNIESRTHVTYGPVVEGIINLAAQEGVDLIALASHGRGGLSRVFYGSVAAGLLHRVDRPLLIIRSRESE
jgi:nucleotide-binding universal stress UspA family protein